MPSRSAGQDWLVSWHRPDDRPDGVPHGAAGVCLAGGQLVLISPDGELWGFGRGECVAGHEEGRVLVRSFWRADVEILPWEPRFEIPHRRLVPIADARAHVVEPDDANTRVSLRALAEAGLWSSVGVRAIVR